jgi:hypothetical protein
MEKLVKQKKYIVDANGKRISVILPIDEYEKLLEAWEELEDIQTYDKTKKSQSDFVDANAAFEEIEAYRKKNK